MIKIEKSLVFLLKESSSVSLSIFTGQVFGGRRLWPFRLLRLSQLLMLPYKQKIAERKKELI